MGPPFSAATRREVFDNDGKPFNAMTWSRLMQEGFGYQGPEPSTRREQEVGELDRAYARFEDRVIQQSGLPAEKARIATAFVLHALEYRMEGNELRRFENSLPPGVDVLLARNRTQDQEFTGLNRATFFRDVARKLDMPTEKVGGVVAGVLTGVREWMDPEEAESFASALPDDMRSLWREPSRKYRATQQPSPAQVARHEAHYSQAYHGLVNDIEMYGGLNRSLAECAVVSVMCHLDSRLMGEGPDLKAQLPKRLQDLLLDCNKSLLRPDKFDLNELFARVARDLQQVFHGVKQHISAGEAVQVADQLPKDIKHAWLCA
jgi:uncharacterized protein (DUF2267 family)